MIKLPKRNRIARQILGFDRQLSNNYFTGLTQKSGADEMVRLFWKFYAYSENLNIRTKSNLVRMSKYGFDNSVYLLSNLDETLRAQETTSYK